MTEHDVLDQAFAAHEHLTPDLLATTSGIRRRAAVHRRRHRIATAATGVAVAAALAVPVVALQARQAAAPGGTGASRPAAQTGSGRHTGEPIELGYVPAGFTAVSQGLHLPDGQGGYWLVPAGRSTYGWNDPNVRLDRVTPAPAESIPPGSRQLGTFTDVTVNGQPAILETYPDGYLILTIHDFDGHQHYWLTVESGRPGLAKQAGGTDPHNQPGVVLSRDEVFKIASETRWAR